jgi:peptidoglycan-associated lipoprotein
MVTELMAGSSIPSRERNMYRKTLHIFIATVLVVSAAACKPRQPKVTTAPDPGANAPVETVREEPKPLPPAPTTPPPVARVEETPIVRPAEDSVASSALDDLNRSGLLKPAFFPVDSFELNDEGRMIVSANAEVLKKYATWMITVEGHADERGTAEYNLALGEKRANAVKTYLVSLGVSPDRLKVVSYGKEFPFDPGHDESAWSKNRRAHFVITAK